MGRAKKKREKKTIGKIDIENLLVWDTLSMVSIRLLPLTEFAQTARLPHSPKTVTSSFTDTPTKSPLIPYSPSRYTAHGRIFFLSFRIASTISTTAADGA